MGGGGKLRLIVCGSRDWTDREAVFDALDSALNDAHIRSGKPRTLTVVHGACPTGADKFADEWCALHGVAVERHSADWSGGFGGAAGPLRNRRMANRGADLCLAFWDGKTKRSGTLNMITEATLAGIPVRIFPRVRK